MIDNCFIKQIQERHGSQVDLDLGMKAHGIPAEEADNILDAFAEFVFRCTAPDTEKAEREQILTSITSVPDPQPGHTGCEDCDCNGYDECDKCSPPPAPIAPALKEKYNPPVSEKKPAAKRSGDRMGGRILICPYCQKEVNSHGSHVHMKAHGPEIYAEWLKDPDRLGHGVGAKPAPKRGGSQGHNPNKYGIPRELWRTDKKQYDRLTSLCKSHGLTYEQALVWKKLPSRTKGDGKQGKKKDTVKQSAQAIASSNEVKEPAPAVVETTPWPGQAKLRELTKAANGTLKVGQRVKHNGSKASPHYGQMGEITAINKEELHVTFPGGSTRLPSYLVLAMPEVKA